MSMTLLKLCATVIAAFFPCSAAAEVYQLTPVTRAEEPSLLKDASPEELLERERGKKFVMTFLKASPDEKFRLTSEHYKKRLNRSAEALQKIFDKESYYKIDFQEVTLFDKGKDKHLTIKANVFWTAEGYEGIQTVYFMLVKEKDRWLLDWLVY
jgi:hypothetical protein